MGFFQRLFSKKDPVAGNNTQSEELKRLRELDLLMRSLLNRKMLKSGMDPAILLHRIKILICRCITYGRENHP